MQVSSKLPFLQRLEAYISRYHLPLMPLIWGITCLIIGVLTLIGLYSYSTTEKAIAHQFNAQQLSIAKQTALGVESFLREVQDDIFLLTHLPEINGLSLAKAKHILPSFFNNFHGRISFLIFGDKRGQFIYYPSEPPLPMAINDIISWNNFEKIRKSRAPLLIEKFLKGSDSTPGIILITAPIFKGGEFQGIISGGFYLQLLEEKFLFSLPIEEKGSSWIINQEGLILAHAVPKLERSKMLSGKGQPLPGIYQEIGQLFEVIKSDIALKKAGMREALFKGQNEEGKKIKNLVAYAPLLVAENIWAVILITPHSEVTQVVWASFKNSIVLLAIMAGTLLAGTYVGHKINQSRIRAEEKVKWSEEILKTQNRLQILFDGSPDAIVIIDRCFRITMLNKTGLNWYKKSLDDFLGKICYQEFQGRSEPCPNCPAQETFQTGKIAYRDRATLIAEGNKKYLQLYTFPLADQNGEVQEVVEYVKDVTAEKELQQQIIQSERLAVVGKMSANVAHEIKNPLGTIVLNAELLEDELSRLGGGATEEARQLLRVIKGEIDHLLVVIEEYLQFARLPKLKLEPGNINEVVSNLLLFLREEAVERKVFVVEELTEILPPALFDAKQLRQALLNIIKNSFEAMPEGGKLTLATNYKNGRVEVSIADTGRGIPEENLDLIFTPFFSTKHGGTGLGLSITSHIIREHQGSINVKSYKDLGTIFTISLPALSTEKDLFAGKERKP